MCHTVLNKYIIHNIKRDFFFGRALEGYRSSFSLVYILN